MPDKENLFKVYKHTAPNKKVYIGITCRSLNKRANYNGTGYMNCPLFWTAIKKYGWDNITHEVLYKNLTKEEAEAKEIELIAQYKANNIKYGYNLDNGGNTIGTHSEATRKKMSKALKGKGVGRIIKESTREKYRQRFLTNNPQKGKPLTQAQKDLISKANKGRLAGSKHPKARAVRCINTGIIYPTVKEAGEAVNVAYMNIIQSIQHNHRRKHAGNINGEPLSWEYVA